jgi:hypothetical protein
MEDINEFLSAINKSCSSSSVPSAAPPQPFDFNLFLSRELNRVAVLNNNNKDYSKDNESNDKKESDRYYDTSKLFMVLYNNIYFMFHNFILLLLHRFYLFCTSYDESSDEDDDSDSESNANDSEVVSVLVEDVDNSEDSDDSEDGDDDNDGRYLSDNKIIFHRCFHSITFS